MEDIELGNEDGGGGGEHSGLTEIIHDDRLKASCCANCPFICFGLIFFFGAFPLLYVNEARSVKRYDALNEAESQVLSISSPWSINNETEGKLIHFSANITNANETVLEDPLFGIQSSTEALKLHRQAEMYQWVEKSKTRTKKTSGGGKTKTTTYSYSKQWRDHLVNSNHFHRKDGHSNPSSKEFDNDVIVGSNIKIGAYSFPDELVDKLDWYVPLDVSPEDITSDGLKSRAVYSDGYYYFSKNYNSSSSSSPASAQIGDQRVSFRETPPSIITIVGVQNGGTLGAFVSKTGEGGNVLLFKRGNSTSVEMFDAAENENRAATWVTRFGGWLMMAVGLCLLFQPIQMLADKIPCVGSIIEWGVILMAVTVSAILSLVTISVAWFVARPKTGAIVLCVSLPLVGLCAFGVKKLKKKKKNEEDVNDDEVVASSNISGGKVAAGTAPPASPVADAVVESPTVNALALPEGQIVASVPVVASEPYVPSSETPHHQSSAPPYQSTVTVEVEPYVPKY